VYIGRDGTDVQSNQLPALHIQILSFAMWMEAVSQFEMFIPLYQNSRRHRKKWGNPNLEKGYLHMNKTQKRESKRNRVTNAAVMLLGCFLFSIQTEYKVLV